MCAQGVWVGYRCEVNYFLRTNGSTTLLLSRPFSQTFLVPHTLTSLSHDRPWGSPSLAPNSAFSVSHPSFFVLIVASTGATQSTAQTFLKILHYLLKHRRPRIEAPMPEVREEDDDHAYEGDELEGCDCDCGCAGCHFGTRVGDEWIVSWTRD